MEKNLDIRQKEMEDSQDEMDNYQIKTGDLDEKETTDINEEI